MIKLYYRDISKFSLLTGEEEQQLVILVGQGDEQARKALIESHLLLVTKIARQYRQPNIELLDLIQEGNLALIEAVDRFSPELGTRFSTFVVWRIHKAIQKFIGINNNLLSLETPILDEDGQMRFLSDSIVDEENIMGSPSCETVDFTMEQREIIELLQHRMAKLSTKERKILEMLYGMDGQKPKSIYEVASTLGICRQRLQRIVKKAMRRLK